MMLDFAHALEAVLEHALVPFRVEHPGPGLEIDLFAQRPDLGRPALRGIDDIDRCGRAARLFNRLAHAAEAIDIMVDVGNAELDRFQILVGQFDPGQFAFEQGALLRRLAAAAIGIALVGLEHIGQLVGITPRALVDHHVDIGAIGTLPVGKDAQACGFQVAVMLRLMRQAVLADEILFGGLVGHRRQIGGFGDHPRLQRQQVAEDARQGDHHVDPRPPQFRQRDQLRAGQPAIIVKSWPGAEKRQRLGDLGTLALQIVRAPQHHGDAFGQRAAVRQMPLDQLLGLRPALHTGKLAGNTERVEAV